MASDFFGVNLNFDDYDLLLKKEDLIEEPVPLQTFVTDRRYLGLEFGLSDIQIEIAKHVTQIFKPETLELLKGTQFLLGPDGKSLNGDEYYRNYTVNEIICQLGKGSGKDHTSRVSLAYIAYLLHCLRDPLEYFGKASGVYIDLVNLAVNAKQAQQVFFDPLKNLLLRSPWANEVGFEPRVSEIFWFKQPIRMFSGHSEAEGWEGYEVLVVVLDEISAFKIEQETNNDIRSKGSAKVIYEMARASITSRFPRVGKVVLLSFPRFKGDFIQQRYNSVINDLKEQGAIILPENGGNKGAYREDKSWALKAKTWEVNPTRTEEEFEDEKRRDPIMWAARYCCEPPEMEDAFFRDAESVRKAFHFKDNPIDDEGRYKEWFRGADSAQRFIHVDLALGKRDRAALCMVHCPGFKKIKTGIGVESLPIIEMDYLEYWEANPYQEIDFSEIRGKIVELARRFDVALVTFDQWQSVDMIQSLRSFGINADTHAVAKRDYDTLSTTIYDERFRGYWNEILVEDELLKLKLITGSKVDHPSSGHKDLADSVAGATYMCLENISYDIEINVEIFSDVDYDELTNEDIDKITDQIIKKSEVKEEDPIKMPDEVALWLDML